MVIATQRYKNDGRLRKRLFVPSAFAHPAKGHISLWEEMILRYSNEGDLVLDPLAGIGTSLVAALMGRNVICVELEQHFVEPMRQSWEKMRNMPMLGYQMGQAMILRGDARCLPLPDASVGAAITSPPFGGEEQHTGGESSTWAKHYTNQKTNQGYTRPVDAIVTSPPYEGSTESDESFRKQVASGYFSPIRQGRKPTDPFIGGKEPYKGMTGENIGNLRSAAYWSAMRQVYAECWRVLRPGGILALVLKGFTRAGEYVDLPGQTEALLLAAGWEKHDHWRRELWSLSFWRILQRRRDPAAFDERLKYEEVRAFRKPGADGGGVAAVITSPPYEGSVAEHDESSDATSKNDPRGIHARGGYTRPKEVATWRASRSSGRVTW